MPLWLIEPRDPLIARDGRPFGPNPGARARSLAFPFPSTTTGALRTGHGMAAGWTFNAQEVAQAKQLGARGPLLVELDEDGEISRFMAPAPVDALLFESAAATARIRQLQPLDTGSATTNMPAGLTPVGLREYDPAKPLANPPTFWRWEKYEEWLLTPGDQDGASPAALGHRGPLRDERMHVSVLPDQQTAREGALFQTVGLEFATKAGQRPAQTDNEAVADQVRVGGVRLALAVDSAATPAPGLAPLGGERRIASWRQSQKTLPACPPAVRAAIKNSGACRLLLLTPACFAAGYHPDWALQCEPGVQVTLKAAAVARAQVVSGWDFATNKPKPTRRLAPAGSVFFLCLRGDPAAIGRWVDRIWMQCISDDPTDRLDGFGLAALGCWNDSGCPDGGTI